MGVQHKRAQKEPSTCSVLYYFIVGQLLWKLSFLLLEVTCIQVHTSSSPTYCQIHCSLGASTIPLTAWQKLPMTVQLIAGFCDFWHNGPPLSPWNIVVIGFHGFPLSLICLPAPLDWILSVDIPLSFTSSSRHFHLILRGLTAAYGLMTNTSLFATESFF